jgi:hypothetical protein
MAWWGIGIRCMEFAMPKNLTFKPIHTFLGIAAVEKGDKTYPAAKGQIDNAGNWPKFFRKSPDIGICHCRGEITDKDGVNRGNVQIVANEGFSNTGTPGITRKMLPMPRIIARAGIKRITARTGEPRIMRKMFPRPRIITRAGFEWHIASRWSHLRGIQKSAIGRGF